MAIKDISREVLETIKKMKITPKPRWEFLLKNYIIWALGVLALVIGSLATAVIIYMTINNDWDLYQFSGNGVFGYLFLSLPYYWLLALSLFILTAYYNIKHTDKGYQYDLRLIIALSVGISVVSGILFYNFGLGKAIDNIFARNISVYRNYIHRNPGLWFSPDRGILTGEITEIEEEQRVILRDLRGKNWDLFFDIGVFKFQPEFLLGNRVITIGEILSETEFRVKAIRPWVRDMMFGPGPNPMNKMRK